MANQFRLHPHPFAFVRLWPLRQSLAHTEMAAAIVETIQRTLFTIDVRVIQSVGAFFHSAVSVAVPDAFCQGIVKQSGHAVAPLPLLCFKPGSTLLLKKQIRRQVRPVPESCTQNPLNWQPRS